MKVHRLIALLFLVFCSPIALTQVFNHGVGEVLYKNIEKYGLTYSKCDNEVFDSTVIAALEELWTVSEFRVIERLDRPESKHETMLFITKKDRTRKYFQDRKNPNVMVMYPGAIYKVKKDDVNMENCLGYMFFDGFFELLEEENEHLFIKMMIGSLNEGIKWIKEHKLTKVGDELNASISAFIIKESGTPLGNTLLIHREQTRSFVDMDRIKKANIRHRLIGQDEYYNLIKGRDKQHFVLYVSQNRFTEISIINIATGAIVYTKHFLDDYPTLKPKEIKEIAVYFG